MSNSMKNSFGLTRGEVVTRKHIRVLKNSGMVSMRRNEAGEIIGPGTVTPCTIEESFPVRDGETTVDDAKMRLSAKGYEILGVIEA